MSSVVPEGWSEEYISEYFDFCIGGTPSRNNELYWDANQTTSNIWVSIKDLKDKFISNSAERISDLGVSKSNVKLLPKNTVLMSFKLSIGRLAISMTPLYTNEAIVGFIEKRPNTVDRDYLYYGLQSWNLLGEVDQAVKGATLNKDKMSRILGVFPPLPEQKKIASILTSVDEVIENTQKQIDKLQDLKKATMNELLTKGIGHTEFKDSELGRIPKSWEVVQLEELLSDLTYGLTVRPKYQSLGVPLVSGKECKNGWIDFSIANLISEDDFVGLRQRSLPKVGDVLFTKTGTLGRIAVVKAEYPKFALSQNVALLTPDFNVVVPKFLAYLCESESIKQQTKLGASTLSVQDLQLGIMRKFRVPKVPIDEQYNIIKVIDALGLRLDRVERKLSQTQSLKKSLMQDLLTGKVRVTVN